MSIITDTFFGGAEKKAAKAQTKGIEKGIAATKESTAQARADAIPLFGAAQQNLQQGFQGALDVFGQTIPGQGDVFQQGNLGAQQQLLAGLPQIQNALLGGQVDFSQLQPTQINADFGFAQQQLPQFVNPFAPQPQAMGPAVPEQNPFFSQFNVNGSTNNLLGGNQNRMPDFFANKFRGL